MVEDDPKDVELITQGVTFPHHVVRILRLAAEGLRPELRLASSLETVMFTCCPWKLPRIRKSCELRWFADGALPPG